MIDGEREFRLRPGKPHVSKPRHDGIAFATGFKMLMHYARQSSARRRGSSAGVRRFPHRQRCAVRITYSKSTVRGKWRAHGRYLECGSAAHGETGFDAHKSDVDVSRNLQNWQANKDQLLWKFVISPEFGERADLQRLTRELMLRVNEDLGGSLEWVAVIHRNTEHPHVHVALRGTTADGRALRLNRDYVKCGVREVAEDLCTRQLGFRTALDAAEAERREIPDARFTSMDRLILRNSAAVENGLAFTPTADAGRGHNHHVAARLIALLAAMATCLSAIASGDPNFTFQNLPIGVSAPLAIALLHVTTGTPLCLTDEIFDAWLKSDGTVAECSRCGYRMPAPWPTCAVCGGATGEGGVWTRTRAAKAGMN